MGLLSRKPKVSIEEFCRQFYDTYVFNPTVLAGVDVGEVFWETSFNSVVEADKSFRAVDHAKFRHEMTALRMELFGLAWMHKFKQGELTIPQSIFTRHYLEENRRSEIWDVMGEYNYAIAQSATMTKTGEQIGEQIGGRISRALVVTINQSRANMLVKWAEANIGDPSAMTEEQERLFDCVCRVANRIGADIRRNDCILVKRLTARLADRLGCDISLNSEALFRLGVVIFGLYEGAKEVIKDVNLASPVPAC